MWGDSEFEVPAPLRNGVMYRKLRISVIGILGFHTDLKLQSLRTRTPKSLEIKMGWRGVVCAADTAEDHCVGSLTGSLSTSRACDLGGLSRWIWWHVFFSFCSSKWRYRYREYFEMDKWQICNDYVIYSRIDPKFACPNLTMPMCLRQAKQAGRGGDAGLLGTWPWDDLKLALVIRTKGLLKAGQNKGAF